MQKIKSLASQIKQNFTEIWLGFLLFVGLPLVIGYYFGVGAFFAASFTAQAAILTLSIYRANK